MVQVEQQIAAILHLGQPIMPIPQIGNLQQPQTIDLCKARIV